MESTINNSINSSSTNDNNDDKAILIADNSSNNNNFNDKDIEMPQTLVNNDDNNNNDDDDDNERKNNMNNNNNLPINAQETYVINKLINKVQSYINECFEMDETNSNNNNNNNTSNNYDDNNNNNHSDNSEQSIHSNNNNNQQQQPQQETQSQMTSSSPVISSPLLPSSSSLPSISSPAAAAVAETTNVAILPMIQVNQASTNDQEQQILNSKENNKISDNSNNNINTNNNNSNIKRIMTIPTIHVTNEHGQDRRISIDTISNSNNMNHSSNMNNSNQQQSPNQQNKRKIAVVVKNVSFSYTKKVPILSNINLVIPKAQIFALLGASGCGKTTLLRIILGRLKPKSGDVQIFGARPGSVYSNVPGSGVGFMPQELAMFPTFTIEETLYYFGLLHHIPKDEIEKRTDFMIELLNLPPKDRKIQQCSGGQQRRASIALTLFHSPPLLILDEPTVGVDPLLRLKIWQYLEHLCVNNRMTIIITTHYIEESRRANCLAFMRFGRILTHDSPENLLNKYETTVLEDVFLKLCQRDTLENKQNQSIKKNKQSNEQSTTNNNDSSTIIMNDLSKDNDNKSNSNNNQLINDNIDHYFTQNESEMERLRSKYYNFTVDKLRLKALFFKNLVNLKRNPLLFFFFLLLPTIQIILFCISVYKSPDNIDISIYNNDTDGTLAKSFIEMIDHDLMNVKFYDTLESAVQSVVDGRSWVAIEMSDQFTAAYKRRAKNPSDLDDRDYNNSRIKLYVDQTDNFIHNVVDNSIMYSYQKFVAKLASSFGYNPNTVKLPIDIAEIVYGGFDQERGYILLHNLIPGALVAIIYTTPLILSSMILVLERKDNVIERTFVNGATSIEVFVSHLVTLMLSLILQIIILLFVSIIVFDVSILGPLSEVYILLYLQGLTGIFIGLIISAIAKNEVVAVLLSLGFVFPLWMISGVFWPLESIEEWMRNIFWIAPLSLPIRSLHHMFRRGWTYERYEIFLGYLSSFAYNIILFIVNIFVFHYTSQ